MISGVREAGASLAVAGRAAFAALFGRCSATGGGGGCTTLSGGGGAPGGGGGGAGSGCTTPGGTGGGNGGAGCIRTGGGSGGALVSAFRKLWPHFGQNLAAGAQVFSHCGQRAPTVAAGAAAISGLPQPRQNFAVGAFSAPHLVQAMSDSPFLSRYQANGTQSILAGN